MTSSEGSITGYIHEIERGGNRDEAARLLRERFAEELARYAVRRLRADRVGSPDSLREAADQIAELYERWKKPAKAMEWRNKSAHTLTPSELDGR